MCKVISSNVFFSGKSGLIPHSHQQSAFSQPPEGDDCETEISIVFNVLNLKATKIGLGSFYGKKKQQQLKAMFKITATK